MVKQISHLYFENLILIQPIFSAKFIMYKLTLE
jgi:hypothetical protein